MMKLKLNCAIFINNHQHHLFLLWIIYCVIKRKRNKNNHGYTKVGITRNTDTDDTV